MTRRTFCKLVVVTIANALAGELDASDDEEDGEQ